MKQFFTLLLVLCIMATTLCACKMPPLSGGTTTAGNGFNASETTGQTGTNVQYQTPAKHSTEFGNRYFNQLTENEQVIYLAVQEKGSGEKVEVNFPITFSMPCSKDGVPSDEALAALSQEINLTLKTALTALWLDDPSFFWMELGVEDGRYNFSSELADATTLRITGIDFTAATKEIYQGKVEQTEAALQKRLQDIPVEGNTVAEKVASINAWIYDHLSYDEERPVSDESHEAYFALTRGVAVCDGYSRLFQLLCQREGINCICVIGDGVTSTGAEGHMWNMVQLENGRWYAVDATWNDTLQEKDVFLLTGANESWQGLAFTKSHLSYAVMQPGTREMFLPMLEESRYSFSRKQTTAAE